MSDLLIAGQPVETRHAPSRFPDRPTLVFLHDGLGCAAVWRDVPARLADVTDCGTLVYSRLGYGSSSPRPLPWPAGFLDEEAEQVLPALLDAHDVSSAILVGHSDGGTVALLAAAANPTRVRGVVTEAAHVMVDDVTVSGLRDLRARFDAGDLDAGLAKLHGNRGRAVFEGWAGAWQSPAFVGWDIRPRLQAVRCPVFAMQGDTDEFGRPAQLADIAAGCSAPVETWLIANCGHTPHRDHPDTFVRRVASFITALIPPST